MKQVLIVWMIHSFETKWNGMKWGFCEYWKVLRNWE
jgi:hypothetical protein